MEYLDLTRAAHLLATLTDDPSAMDDVQAIMRAGAAGKIPVYWFNDLHQATYIADFTDSEHRNLRATYSVGPQQMTHSSLRELAISESLAVFDFEFTDQDFALLEKIKGKAVDDDGNLLGYRHPDTTDGTVTITREQLFVYAHDLKAYAATLAPDAVPEAPAHAPAMVNQVQISQADLGVVSWTLKKPPYFKKYNEAVYKYLKAAFDEKAPNRPTASDMIDAWRKASVAPIIGVEGGIARYENSKGVSVDIGETPIKNLENIRKSIGGMTTKNKP